LPAARVHLEEAYALARELGNKREIATAANQLAMVHRLEGHPDRAERLYVDAVGLMRELGDRESVAIVLLNLAMIAIDGSAPGAARAMLLEVLDIAEEIGSKPVGHSALEVCAGLASASANWNDAARFSGIVEAQMARTGLRRDPADEAFLAPWIARARTASGSEFAAAESAGRQIELEDGLVQVRAWLVARSDPGDSINARSRSTDQAAAAARPVRRS
jgi:hypothetical protein